MRFGYRRRRWWWCWDWDGLSGRARLGRGEKSGVEALHFPSLALLCWELLPVPGARCKVQGARGGGRGPAPKHPSTQSTRTYSSRSGLLIFDCVHGPPAVGPHRPLAVAHWPRKPRAGDAPALGHPTVYQLAGALTSLGQELDQLVLCAACTLQLPAPCIFLPVASQQPGGLLTGGYFVCLCLQVDYLK